jgi:hypothetical protein
MERVPNKINIHIKQVDTDMGGLCQEQSCLSTSISNVQTQVLEKQRRFEHTSSSGFDCKYGPP